MKRVVILAMLVLTSACATWREPDGEQVPLFHPDYKSEAHEDLRREINYKNITTGKNPDNKMPGYKIYEGEEDNRAWGSAYTN